MRRARRYILRVRPDGSLRVTVPRGGSRSQAEAFVKQNSKWIDRERSRVRREHSPVEWHDGSEIMYRGALVRIAVQEYGASNPDLLAGLEARGARVTPVPVYQWALPEDIGPLRSAVRAIADGGVDVALFTSATQAVHLMKIAEEEQLAERVRAGLGRMVIASIGPTTSEELRQQGIQVDLEASHPKMGFLAREAAERAPELLSVKRASDTPR